jgi:hypothetical protein
VQCRGRQRIHRQVDAEEVWCAVLVVPVQDGGVEEGNRKPLGAWPEQPRQEVAEKVIADHEIGWGVAQHSLQARVPGGDAVDEQALYDDAQQPQPRSRVFSSGRATPKSARRLGSDIEANPTDPSSAVNSAKVGQTWTSHVPVPLRRRGSARHRMQAP